MKLRLKQHIHKYTLSLRLFVFIYKQTTYLPIFLHILKIRQSGISLLSSLTPYCFSQSLLSVLIYSTFTLVFD